MRDIPEAEARDLLIDELRCINCEPWVPLKLSKHTSSASAGTLDSQGANTGIQVDLMYYLHPTTQVKRFVFSVYKQRPYGLERIYQLDVRTQKNLKDSHAKPHEHFGDRRIDGDDSWAVWSYDDALIHFCKSTKIKFEPSVKSPEDAFKLT